MPIAHWLAIVETCHPANPPSCACVALKAFHTIHINAPSTRRARRGRAGRVNSFVRAQVEYVACVPVLVRAHTHTYSKNVQNYFNHQQQQHLVIQHRHTRDWHLQVCVVVCLMPVGARFCPAYIYGCVCALLWRTKKNALRLMI